MRTQEYTCKNLHIMVSYFAQNIAQKKKKKITDLCFLEKVKLYLYKNSVR